MTYGGRWSKSLPLEKQQLVMISETFVTGETKINLCNVKLKLNQIQNRQEKTDRQTSIHQCYLQTYTLMFCMLQFFGKVDAV